MQHLTMFATVLLAFAATVEAVARSGLLGTVKMQAARNLELAGLPDPHCKTGKLSLADGSPQVCCAGYCNECSDYPACSSVRGQNSTFACCKTEVLGRKCGDAPANVCLKSCKESVPPCIMEEEVVFTTPNQNTRTAGSDCNEAVADWRQKAAAATQPQQRGP